MKCSLWIPWPKIPIREAAEFLAYLRSEPWECDFPMRWLADLSVNDLIVSAPEEIPMYRRDFDRTELFFSTLADRFQNLTMSLVGYYDPDPDRPENAPEDYGGVFSFSIEHGIAKSDLNPL